MMDTKTIIIIVIVVGGIYWLSQNQPETYESGKTTLQSIIGDIIDWGKEKISGNPAPEDTEEQSGEEEEDQREGDLINYGKPYQPYECNSDVQCIRYFPEAFDVKCRLETGECMGEIPP